MSNRTLSCMVLLLSAGCGAKKIAEVKAPAKTTAAEVSAVEKSSEHAPSPPAQEGMGLLDMTNANAEDALLPQNSAEDLGDPDDGTVAEPGGLSILLGTSVPVQDAEPSFGLNVSHVQWWLSSAWGRSVRPYSWEKPETRVRPVCQTVTLERDGEQLHLLGPDGDVLVLSLTEGPLAEANPFQEGQSTTFAFTPDGTQLAFANAEGTICRVDLSSQKLTKSTLAGVNAGNGVLYNREGTKIAYSRYSRKDNYSPGYHHVFVADADFANERKLTEYEDMKTLGYDFLPDGRVAVVGATSVAAFAPETGESETVASWEKPLQFRSFCGFSPDGTKFSYDLGGPYVLTLFSFDLATTQRRVIRQEYLESFQPTVWVRTAPRE